jgi:hypothetical protein
VVSQWRHFRYNGGSVLAMVASGHPHGFQYVPTRELTVESWSFLFARMTVPPLAAEAETPRYILKPDAFCVTPSWEATNQQSK